jgi:hypothetical protein
MKFKIAVDLGDSLANAPAYEVEVGEIGELEFILSEEMIDDSGRPVAVGAVVTIERVA